MEISVKVVWPSAPLTLSLVHNALNAVDLKITDSPSKFFLQWSSYDSLDHERAHFNRSTVLSSSYTFRKSLIRKHFLSRAIYAYLKKDPDSLLSNAAPRTYEIELSFADELDEMWTDDLWDLGAELDNHSWWILKPLGHSSFVSAQHSFSVNTGEWLTEEWESGYSTAKKICITFLRILNPRMPMTKTVLRKKMPVEQP